MIKRPLTLDVFDYSDHLVINLYDSSKTMSGEAYNIHKTDERNGWKELSFSLPSVCQGENGDEDNYRLKYLIADYKIRFKTDTETDWFIISEPKITHNNFSKNVDVRAGHVSQLLKTKKLSLEFSDDEGNNVGTAEEFLECILDGTDWNVGNVAEFLEEDILVERNGEMVHPVKYRTLSASSKTGAFKLIENVCDLFEAKPVYHGDTQTVDIIPMNPFSNETEEGKIPDEVINHNANVLELHYERNVKNISRTINAENIVTKLYGYGSYGDRNGLCSLQTATHDEFTYELLQAYSEGTEMCFTDAFGATYYFVIGRNMDIGDKLTWSRLDFASRSYIWDENYVNDEDEPLGHAYHLTSIPVGNIQNVIELDDELVSTMTVKNVQNLFPYIFDFRYYDKIGLFTEDMFQEVAKYQRNMGSMYNTSMEKATAFINDLNRVSDVGNPQTGFLRLNAVYRSNEDKTSEVLIDWRDTDPSDKGVIYRSDYSKTRKNYFSWRVAKQLKANGDPVSGSPSYVLIAHHHGTQVDGQDTQPVTWEKAWIKEVYVGDDNDTFNLVTASDGTAGDFIYQLQDEDIFPTKLVLWAPMSKDGRSRKLPVYSEGDELFLFCSDSRSGMLGALEAQDEAIINIHIRTATATASEDHPVYFMDGRPLRDSIPDLSVVQIAGQYGWYYKYYFSEPPVIGDYKFGKLYFCGPDDTTWYPVYTGQTFPTNAQFNNEFGVNISNGCYFFDTAKRLLYCYAGHWVELESDTMKRITEATSQVIMLCKQRDQIYKGIYEKYYHQVTGLETGASTSLGYLPIGRYLIPNEFGAYWAFTTTENVVASKWLYVDTTNKYVYQSYDSPDTEEEDVLTPNIVTATSINEEVISFMPETIADKNTFSIGWLDADTGAEKSIDYFNGGFKGYRSPYIRVYPGETYYIDMPLPAEAGNNSYYGFIMFYDSAKNKRSILTIDPSNTMHVSNGRVVGNFVVPTATTIDVSSSNYRPDAEYIRIAWSGAAFDYTDEQIEQINSQISSAESMLQRLQVQIDILDARIAAGEPIDQEAYDLAVEQKAEQEQLLVQLRATEENYRMSIQIENYQHKAYLNDNSKRLYTVLSVDRIKGDLLGLNNLMAEFLNKANKCYLESLIELQQAQDAIKQADVNLMRTLGLILREGYWQDNSYVEGDEDKLYRDALKNLNEIAKPQISYSISFLDEYGSNHNIGYSVDGVSDDVEYPDIQITDAAHLIDPAIDTDCWAYIDKVDKCYDMPWETGIEINTRLSLIGQHDFTDVLSSIAEVAKMTKGQQSMYQKAAQFAGIDITGYAAANAVDQVKQETAVVENEQTTVVINGETYQAVVVKGSDYKGAQIDFATLAGAIVSGADISGAVSKGWGVSTAVSEMVQEQLNKAMEQNNLQFSNSTSKWYVDAKTGGIIFERADGKSALMISGCGFAGAKERDDTGNWHWTTFGTGEGIYAESIMSGNLNANLLKAGSITADKLAADTGQLLSITSNKGLDLYSTTDGAKPAGALQTTDAMIEIHAGDPSADKDEDKYGQVNILSGGIINLKAGRHVEKYPNRQSFPSYPTKEAGETDEQYANRAHSWVGELRYDESTEKYYEWVYTDSEHPESGHYQETKNNGWINIESNRNIKIQAGASIDLKAGETGDQSAEINVESTGNVNIRSGGAINLEAETPVERYPTYNDLPSPGEEGIIYYTTKNSTAYKYENNGYVPAQLPMLKVGSTGEIDIQSTGLLRIASGGNGDPGGKILIESTGSVEMNAGSELTLGAGAENASQQQQENAKLNVLSTGEVNIKGGTINVRAGNNNQSGKINVSSTGEININSEGNLNIGSNVTINDYVFADSKSLFPIPGDTNKYYYDDFTNKTWIWDTDTSAYVEYTDYPSMTLGSVGRMKILANGVLTLSSSGSHGGRIVLESASKMDLKAGSSMNIGVGSGESPATLNVSSSGEINIAAGGTLNLKSPNASGVAGGIINIEADTKINLYSKSELNIGAGKVENYGSYEALPLIGEQGVLYVIPNAKYVWSPYSATYVTATDNLATLSVVSSGAINLNGGSINVNSGSDINVDAGGTVDITGGAINVTSQGSVNITAGTLSINTNGALDVNTTNFKLNSATNTIDIKTSNFTIDSEHKKVTSGNFSIVEHGFVLDKVQQTDHVGNIHSHFVLGDYDNMTQFNNDAYAGILYNNNIAELGRSGTWSAMIEPEIIIFGYDKANLLKFDIRIGGFAGAIYDASGRTLDLGTITYPLGTGYFADLDSSTIRTASVYTASIIPKGGDNTGDIGDSTHSFEHIRAYHMYTSYLYPKYGEGTGSIGVLGSAFGDIYVSNIHSLSNGTISSRDYKHNIKPIELMGNVLDKLKPVTFVYNKDKNERTRYGLIYEDTVDILPDICIGDKDSKSIEYTDLVSILLKEIQDLRRRVKSLEEA